MVKNTYTPPIIHKLTKRDYFCVIASQPCENVQYGFVKRFLKDLQCSNTFFLLAKKKTKEEKINKPLTTFCV